MHLHKSNLQFKGVVEEISHLNSAVLYKTVIPSSSTELKLFGLELL